jgi:hypothetical protein
LYKLIENCELYGNIFLHLGHCLSLDEVIFNGGGGGGGLILFMLLLGLGLQYF